MKIPSQKAHHQTRKCTETKLCTPFCPTDCKFQGEHNSLILSLANLQESVKTSLNDWKASVLGAQDKVNFNQPLEDPDPEFCYTLLHWAAMLGKVKAVEWLLQQEFIDVIGTPKDLVCRQPIVANKLVLFSVVRWLHEGVKTRNIHDISTALVKIFDVFLKRIPDVLLVQEGQNQDTVLHLCARGEEGSNAPFFSYLRRILVKLHEYSEDRKGVPLTNILERKNKAGDTFLHLLAKSDNREEAAILIDFASGKFFGEEFLELQNAEEKTADEILNEVKSDHEIFQPSSQEIDFHLPCSSETTNGRPTACDPVCGVDHQECQSQSASQCNAGVDPEAHSACGEREEKREISYPEDCRIILKTEGDLQSLMENPTCSLRPWEEIHTGKFPEPVPDRMGYQLPPLRSMDDKSGSEILSSAQEYDEGLAKNLAANGKGSTSTQPVKAQGCNEDNNRDSLSRAQGAVRQLVREEELDLNEDKKKLEEARKVVNEYDEQIQRLHKERGKKEAEVQVLVKRVEAKEKRLEDHKESLWKLGNN